MDSQSLAREWSDSVKSFTLAEYISPPPRPPRPPLTELRFVAKTIDFAKKAAIAWGIVSLGAFAGISAYYLNGGSDTPLLITENHSRPSPKSVATAKERLAALLAAPAMPLEPAFTGALPRAQAAVEIPESAPAPLVEARLPRPRPEESIITGSIGPPAYDPYYVAPQRRHVPDPCAALRNLGAPFLFGTRCYQQSRVNAPAPPPPREYAPRPYQPPLVYEE